jgi:hypothetical protein
MELLPVVGQIANLSLWAGKSNDQRMPSGPARPDTFPSSQNLCKERRTGNRADKDAEDGNVRE